MEKIEKYERSLNEDLKKINDELKKADEKESVSLNRFKANIEGQIYALRKVQPIYKEYISILNHCIKNEQNNTLF